MPVVCGFEFLHLLLTKYSMYLDPENVMSSPFPSKKNKKKWTQKITIQFNKTIQRKSRYCCRSAQLFCKVTLCFSHATIDSSIIKNYMSTCSFFPLRKKCIAANRNKCELRFDGTLPHQLMWKIYRILLTYSGGGLPDYLPRLESSTRHALGHEANTAHRSATGLGNSENHMKHLRTVA